MSVKMVESKRIYTGNLLKLNADRVLLSNGRKSYRECVNHPGAVSILPVLEDKSIIMVRQFRYAVSDYLLEIPAGIIEKGEKPEETAIRELKEETGYSADNVEELMWFYPSPGYTNERIYIYRIQCSKPQERKPEGGIEIVRISEDEIDSLIESGRIRDGKSVIALMLHSR